MAGKLLPDTTRRLIEYRREVGRLFKRRGRVLVKPGYEWLTNGDLPEKLIAADYTSPPKLLAPGEVR